MLGEATGSLDPEVCPHPHLLGSQLPWEALAEGTLGLGVGNLAWNKVH